MLSPVYLPCIWYPPVGRLAAIFVIRVRSVDSRVAPCYVAIPMLLVPFSLATQACVILLHLLRALYNKTFEKNTFT